jgi:hypothetical protein
MSKTGGNKTRTTAENQSTDESSILSRRRTRTTLSSTSSIATQRGSRNSTPTHPDKRSLSRGKDRTLPDMNKEGTYVSRHPQPLKQIRVLSPSNINNQAGFCDALLNPEHAAQRSASKNNKKRSNDVAEQAGAKKSKSSVSPLPIVERPPDVVYQLNTDLMDKLEAAEKENSLLKEQLNSQATQSICEVNQLREDLQKSRSLLNSKNVLLSTHKLIEERLTLENAKLSKILSSKDSQIKQAFDENTVNTLELKNSFQEQNKTQREVIEKLLVKSKSLASVQTLLKNKFREKVLIIEELKSNLERIISPLRFCLEKDDSFCTNLIGRDSSFDSVYTEEITNVIHFILGKFLIV